MVQCAVCLRRDLKLKRKTRITPEMVLAYHYVAMLMRNPRNPREPRSARVQSREDDVDVNPGDQLFICRICKMKLTEEMNLPTQLEAEGNQLVPLIFLIPPVWPGHCFICQSENPLFTASFSTRVSIYIQAELYIDEGTKICPSHVHPDTQLLKPTPELLTLRPTEQIVRMNVNQIEAWFREQRQQALHYKNDQLRMQDYMEQLNGDDFYSVFGIYQEQFDDMFSHVDGFVSPSGHKVSRSSLQIFLLKIRQGLSLTYTKALYGLGSKGAVGVRIKVARLALLELFVPRHLGPHARSREEILGHVTSLARTLHLPEGNENNIVLTIDGTYLYIPKSFNFKELKKTYCFHKGRHLIKMNMCVMPDGYILDCHGPYYSDSSNNDAAILTDDLRKNLRGLRDFLQEGDVIVMDRGYRDCIPFLEELGYETDMPRFLERGQRQHSTLDANASRIVTKTRWIVESRNGHLKSIFKLFERVIAAGNVPYIGDYFRIGCAIINAYRPCVHSRNDSVEVGRFLLSRRNQNNEVQAYVIAENLIRRSAPWRPMESVELEEFPRMTEDDLAQLTLGFYQIRQAAGYNSEKEERGGDRVFEVARESPTLLRGKLFSRHRASKEYYQFIRFVPDSNGPESIIGWYCTCITGARTVGMCSHICAIIWYLSVDRYDPFSKRPKPRLDGIAKDAAER